MICVYSTRNSPRLAYVLDYIFIHRLKLSYIYTSDILEFESHTGPKVYYSNSNQTGYDLHIPQVDILFEKGSQTVQPQTITQPDLVKLFHFQEHTQPIDFDLFSAVFYCLSRYEEYNNSTNDDLGRHQGIDSHAYKNDYLTRPVVDEWIAYLIEILRQEFPSFQYQDDASYQVELTIDIDRAYAYANRSAFSNVLGGAKNFIQGDVKIVQNRWNTIVNKSQDPYDTYDTIEHLANGQPINWFFLMKDQRPYDTTIGLDNGSLEKLIKRLASNHEIGVHPSVSSHNDIHELDAEKKLLESLSGNVIHKSRQHYLNLHLPYTYQLLLDIGITDDYSMGYHDVPGFRAGTCFPFPWYNIAGECVTSLMIHPFQLMDVTLKKYLKLTPEKAIEYCKSILDQVIKVNGICSVIWHNSSFYEKEGWKDWGTVLDYILNSNEYYCESNVR